ncbi:TPA: mannitol dehydrogenase family protein [Enterococcus faecium]|uniref:mannitol dehydrogenase family protein n=1 Tax=Enterococcus faecium TaxID=1352 RepID=UPI0002A2C902|nr:mannitol dehydrogenase family protein [Enterococcus faecium]ELB81181.1 fructuronate reductase [Enterococcus faecium EnGen0049]ELB82007.1 fructuronate reductase [Enterococcus faecium EnGen0045]MWG19496.1 mannitol dehydrogenase family protein [Enterococcus faecium]HAQ6362194.1 mannitol dehydrogenase family protein [Enterococcus faecium]HAQ6779262.1 mannitol dehydrogenase family protein [Enterococcus faecium]
MVFIKDWEISIEELNKMQVQLPYFNVKAVKQEGQQHPVWLHFGGGNLYRGFHAEIAQCLADQNELKSGVIVCETFDEEVVEKAYHDYNNDILEIVMSEDGELKKRLLAVTADSLYCNPKNIEDYQRVVKYFEDPKLQFTTFTITEKGYSLKDSKGQFFSVVEADIKSGPTNPQHTMSIVTSLLYSRFNAGELPIAMVSTDNFSQNGQRFQDSIFTIAEAWQKEGYVSEKFIAYLKDKEKVTFPWSMIDRITPNPSESVKMDLLKAGFEDLDIIHTAKNTNIAAFTNTEKVHYLVIEDSFPNGRPKLEAAGVIMTDRETVDKADIMKVTTCLNPLHTALAITGCLLGYKSIQAEMQDDDLVGLIKGIGYAEGLPVVESPGVIDPKQFIDEVINKRLPNPYIPDTPQRIATDTSQKVAIRYGETIKKYVEKDGNAENLTFIPIAIAAWLRYLLVVDDQGKNFVPSPDPLLVELQKKLSVLKLGEQDPAKIHCAVQEILENKEIFGLDLYQVGVGKKIEKIFCEMLVGPQAVRKTINKYITEVGGK